LKLFWEFLEEKQINWIEINLANLAGFVGWLRNHNKAERIIELIEDRSYRQGSTINVILGCLSSFYRFHNELGNTNVTITEPQSLPGNRFIRPYCIMLTNISPCKKELFQLNNINHYQK
jgi:integrase/recombinase XerD